MGSPLVSPGRIVSSVPIPAAPITLPDPFSVSLVVSVSLSFTVRHEIELLLGFGSRSGNGETGRFLCRFIWYLAFFQFFEVTLFKISLGL